MAMPNASSPPGATNVPSFPSPVTLRSLLDARRSEGRRMSLAEAIAIIVPVCVDLQERHARGERLLVHPSSIAPGADGIARPEPSLTQEPPTHVFDRHCLAPELRRTLAGGDACASVFSVGAILYEMLTGFHVGPGMKRPREIDPELPEALEVLIGKAIIGDRAHRPADLGALASALYHVAPQKSIHPPDVNEARLDASAELAVDVRFSMLPPSVAAAAPLEGSGVTSIPRAPLLPRLRARISSRAPRAVDRTSAPEGAPSGRRSGDDVRARLSALKAQLESDPRPRYVVNKERMDHGPFTAVELLQQVASHAFTAEDGLRDEIGGQQMPIGEWEEFAPFAQQAFLLREKRAEEKAVVRAADADKKRGIAKSIVALSFVVALAGVLAVWFFTRRGTRNDNVVVSKDRAGNVEVNGDIKGRKKRAAGTGGGHAVGAGVYSGGQSYEAVLNSTNESMTIGEQPGSADLTNAQLAAPLRHASFVVSCGAPDDMKVTVHVAVRMGVPIGVTVVTSPPQGGVASCIDRAVRGIRWPQSAKTDFVTTSY
jgi:eukaryotic-like serine/threonine-protein kinase